MFSVFDGVGVGVGALADKDARRCLQTTSFDEKGDLQWNRTWVLLLITSERLVRKDWIIIMLI